MTDTVSCGPVVIGAGAVGLAIARELSKEYENVVVLEKELGFGYHTSSRNSEVIHSGIYYPPGSLKSNLCLHGKTKLYSFLERNDIPYKRCGKLILAAEGEELQLQHIIDNARHVGVEFQELSSIEARQMVPTVKCSKAIFIPETGIFDSHEFMLRLEHDFRNSGGILSYSSPVSEIKEYNGGYQIVVDNGTFIINTDTIINSAGLYSDKVAAMAGYGGYSLSLYKGEYYKCNKIKDLPHLIYSVPPSNQMSLGIHTRGYLDGSVGFGPNAYEVNGVDYSLNKDRHHEFISDIHKYLDIKMSPDDIWPDYSGIRPKINGGRISSDFIIKKEKSTESRMIINLIGIESPGLTCALAIGGMIKRMLDKSEF